MPAGCSKLFEANKRWSSNLTFHLACNARCCIWKVSQEEERRMRRMRRMSGRRRKVGKGKREAKGESKGIIWR